MYSEKAMSSIYQKLAFLWTWYFVQIHPPKPILKYSELSDQTFQPIPNHSALGARCRNSPEAK